MTGLEHVRSITFGPTFQVVSPRPVQARLAPSRLERHDARLLIGFAAELVPQGPHQLYMADPELSCNEGQQRD
jgi:hypothetical protein